MQKLFAMFVLAALAHGAAIAETETKGGMALGTKAPNFRLADVSTHMEYSPSDFVGKKALMVVFICRHCPYVQHVKKALAAVGEDYRKKGVQIVAISANDPAAYPDDAPKSLAEMAKEESFKFPFLFDKTQNTAKAYSAKATPDVFIFDKDQKLVYRGQFDDTRPNGGKEADGSDVRAVLDALISGSPVPSEQKPAVGCSIKWK